WIPPRSSASWAGGRNRISRAGCAAPWNGIWAIAAGGRIFCRAAIAPKGRALAADGESGRRRWLVTGGSGQVGRALAETALPENVELAMPPHAALDLAAPPDLDALIAASGA